MSDTPETDALREAIDNGAATEAEMTSLAGKLERELVAQEERQAEAGDRCGLLYWEYGFDWPDAMADELLRTREERDQARRELDIQLESFKCHMEVPVREHPLRADDAPLQDSGAEPQPLQEGEPSDFCGAIRRMRDAERERDNFQDQRDFAIGEIERLRKERDEAREALREIAAADWKTSGELRGMARRVLEAAK